MELLKKLKQRWKLPTKMPSQRLLVPILAFLVVTNLITLFMVMRMSWAERHWQEEMSVWVGYAATVECLSDYREGMRRIYEPATSDSAQGGAQQEFTGRFDGPFEVWTKAYLPDYSQSNHFAVERYIETYNNEMREMYSNPERVSAFW